MSSKNIKNIFFIDRFPFTKNLFVRFEFEKFKALGYNVKFIDISSILKRQKLESVYTDEIAPYRIKFSSTKAFDSFIKTHKDNCLVASTVPFIGSSSWMYLSLFKYKIDYVLLSFESFPELSSPQKNTLAKKYGKVIRFFNRLHFKKVWIKPKEAITFLRAKHGIYPAKMMILSEQKKVRNSLLTDTNTIIRYSFSPDYKEYDRIKDKKRIISEKYAVFIDQYFYHHPDFKTKHIEHEFTNTDYYPQLNTFLESFSKKTGLKVIVASHPRRHQVQEADFNADFDLYYNKTAQLIKDADIVLMHFSTAISFAILSRKPFLLLNSPMLKGTVDEKIKSFAQYFNKEEILLEEAYHPKPAHFEIDEARYLRYQNAFLGHPKAKHETFSEKILSLIHQL